MLTQAFCNISPVHRYNSVQNNIAVSISFSSIALSVFVSRQRALLSPVIMTKGDLYGRCIFPPLMLLETLDTAWTLLPHTTAWLRPPQQGRVTPLREGCWEGDITHPGASGICSWTWNTYPAAERRAWGRRGMFWELDGIEAVTHSPAKT